MALSEAQVREYDPVTDTHVVLYDDGDVARPGGRKVAEGGVG